MGQKLTMESENPSKRSCPGEKISSVERLFLSGEGTEVSSQIFSFLPGRYRLIAPVSKTVCAAYKQATNNKCITSIAVGLENPKTAAILIAEQTQPNESYYCNHAAKHGCLETLKWLRYESPLNWDFCGITAEYGQLEIYFRENGCCWGAGTCYWAARCGQLDSLRYLRGNGCNWDALTCLAAAEGGHLEVLKWARENGCDWDARTCDCAAWNGHLDVLKWAIENGCNWDPDGCLFFADRSGHHDVCEWIEANRDETM